MDILLVILLILLGGLFGWILGKLPNRWVYVIMGITFVIVILLLTKTIGLDVF